MSKKAEKMPKSPKREDSNVFDLFMKKPARQQVAPPSTVSPSDNCAKSIALTDESIKLLPKVVPLTPPVRDGRLWRLENFPSPSQARNVKMGSKFNAFDLFLTGAPKDPAAEEKKSKAEKQRQKKLKRKAELERLRRLAFEQPAKGPESPAPPLPPPPPPPPPPPQPVEPPKPPPEEPKEPAQLSPPPRDPSPPPRSPSPILKDRRKPESILDSPETLRRRAGDLVSWVCNGDVDYGKSKRILFRKPVSTNRQDPEDPTGEEKTKGKDKEKAKDKADGKEKNNDKDKKTDLTRPSSVPNRLPDIDAVPSRPYSHTSPYYG